jgi:hypothetical protein
MDYTLIFFLLFTLIWLYFLDYSFIRKEKGFSYLQVGLMIPLVIYLSHNSFVMGFIFGYLFCAVFVITSIYALAVNMIDLEEKK